MELCVRQEYGMWMAYSKSSSSRTSLPSSVPRINAHPTNRYQYTLLCDGSFKYDIQQAGYGVVLFNSNGIAIDGRAGRLFCKEPLVAEAWAIFTAVRLASSLVGTINILSD
ncbi:hypothetical protein LINGRAHAP2_LOCUS4226 [Linum grandiflorum]